MIVLSEQIAELNREVDLLLAGDENRVAIEEIESAFCDLDSCFKAFYETLEERETLQALPELFPFGDELEIENILKQRVVENYNLVVQSWEDNRLRIRQSGVVGKLVEVIVNYEESLGRCSRERWSAWANSIASDFAIADAQLESIKNVPDYVQQIQEFKTKRERFAANMQRIPENSDGIEQLAELGKQLQKIKSKLVFNLPKNVLRFYDMLDRDKLFPLSEFDAELSKWLSENDELKNLSITRAQRWISR